MLASQLVGSNRLTVGSTVASMSEPPCDNGDEDTGDAELEAGLSITTNTAAKATTSNTNTGHKDRPLPEDSADIDCDERSSSGSEGVSAENCS